MVEGIRRLAAKAQADSESRLKERLDSGSDDDVMAFAAFDPAKTLVEIPLAGLRVLLDKIPLDNRTKLVLTMAKSIAESVIGPKLTAVFQADQILEICDLAEGGENGDSEE